MPKNAQTIGGPRQKLLQVLRSSGASDSSATNLANEALGVPPDTTKKAKKKKKKKKKDPKLRQAIISRLTSVGRAGAKAGFKAGRKKS